MPEETQMQTEIYQIYYEVLSQAAEKGLKYGKPNKIVLHVEKDKGENMKSEKQTCKIWITC